MEIASHQSVQSQEEMNRLHNIQSDSTAVALITKSLQQGAPGSLGLGGLGRRMHLLLKLNILRLPCCLPSYVLSHLPKRLFTCVDAPLRAQPPDAGYVLSGARGLGQKTHL